MAPILPRAAERGRRHDRGPARRGVPPRRARVRRDRARGNVEGVREGGRARLGGPGPDLQHRACWCKIAGREMWWVDPLPDPLRQLRGRGDDLPSTSRASSGRTRCTASASPSCRSSSSRCWGSAPRSTTAAPSDSLRAVGTAAHRPFGVRLRVAEVDGQRRAGGGATRHGIARGHGKVQVRPCSRCCRCCRSARWARFAPRGRRAPPTPLRG